MSNQDKRDRAENDRNVHLLEDPFQIGTDEIADAQNDPGELKLDEPRESAEEESETVSEEAAGEKLKKIAAALKEDHERTVQEFEEKTQDPQESQESEEESNEELARQIAEDLSLEEDQKRQALRQSKDEEMDAPVFTVSEAELDLAEVQSCLEAVLFVSEKPLSLKKLKEMVGPDFSNKLYKNALKELVERYQEAHHGFELVEVAGGYQFRTKPGRQRVLLKLSKVQKQRLSRGAMETLSIIAYKQPILKEEIDRIRGVDSSHFVRGLLERRLISISGRSDLPGRPIIYTTTDTFLEIFGLKDLSALPPLRELEKMVPTSQTGDEEDPKLKRIRKLVGEMQDDRSKISYDPAEDEKILKEIRGRVKSIPVSTPYIDELREAEKEKDPPSGD